ncbi:hypothetical protein ACQCX2_15820 [Propionibacteriaceae bacterium Y1700]|uniref:hypothetical protein n=1 Tax=Microlunatus sp. Y1700 TaxID=3418487 RepID=UPI003DA7139E
MSNPVVLILMFLAVAVAFFALGVVWGRNRRSSAQKELAAVVPLPDFAAGLPAETVDSIDWALASGRKIDAIRTFRDATGLGLADSKRVIDHWDESRDLHRNSEPVGYDLE